MIVRTCLVVAAVVVAGCAGDEATGADADPVSTTSAAPVDAVRDDTGGDGGSPGDERMGVSEHIKISVLDENGRVVGGERPAR